LLAPFDITGDLDTPVSAFMKLGAFRPRFLLESVEGGERLGRYSFIGFGDGLEVRLDASGLTIGAEHTPVPTSTAALLGALRTALARAPRPQPDIAGVPLAGGLVAALPLTALERRLRLRMRSRRLSRRLAARTRPGPGGPRRE